MISHDEEPTSRSFQDAKDLGDQGETAVAQFLAVNAARIAKLIEEPVARVLVKMDPRYVANTRSEIRNGVEITYRPTPKSEQLRGDLVLYGVAETVRYIEVKSEQYGLQRSGAEARTTVRQTKNVAVETHDIISAHAYESLWAQGRRDREQRLIHPPISVPYMLPQHPEWYGKPGGHIKSEADWFIHYFVGSGHCVLLSLRRIKRALRRAKYDRQPWFASCTLYKGHRDLCRQPGGRGINYYTVGKALPVADLEQARRAIVLSPQRLDAST